MGSTCTFETLAVGDRFVSNKTLYTKLDSATVREHRTTVVGAHEEGIRSFSPATEVVFVSPNALVMLNEQGEVRSVI